jgi:hypothetical protein
MLPQERRRSPPSCTLADETAVRVIWSKYLTTPESPEKAVGAKY